MQIHFSRFLRQLTLAAGALAVSSSAWAQTASTDPVGAIVIPLQGSSDTPVSLPVHRPVALEAIVASMASNVITLQAPATLTASQFVYAVGTQSNTYYVQFLTGQREGMYYTVTANDTGSLTLNLNGDGAASTAVQPGDILQVIPYWTLNTLFPAGQGVNASPGFTPGQRNSEVFFFNEASVGINLAAATDFYYYNGNVNVGAGWREVGQPNGTLQNDTVIYPDNYFIVRNDIPGNTQLVITGGVPMSAYTTPLSTLQSNTAQDIHVSISVPVGLTLAQSGLYTGPAGAFAGSSSFSPQARQDELLAFDYVDPLGKNPAATSIYYYYTGATAGGQGWRKVGQPNTSIFDAVQVFNPGQGYIIRKIGTPSAETVVWSFVPSYLTP
jgi:uncharacterized protein (TIGR02597 family)